MQSRINGFFKLIHLSTTLVKTVVKTIRVIKPQRNYFFISVTFVLMDGRPLIYRIPLRSTRRIKKSLEVESVFLFFH